MKYDEMKGTYSSICSLIPFFWLTLYRDDLKALKGFRREDEG